MGASQEIEHFVETERRWAALTQAPGAPADGPAERQSGAPRRREETPHRGSPPDGESDECDPENLHGQRDPAPRWEAITSD
ncbi:MAG: hypothetical protein WD773_03035 [Gemmatimonadales bacterium]